MKRAMFIKRANIGAGDALLYKLSDPVKVGDIETLDVVVSAVTVPIGEKGEKVSVFAADEEGTILSYDVIAEKGGTLDHEEILVDLGYEVM